MIRNQTKVAFVVLTLVLFLIAGCKKGPCYTGTDAKGNQVTVPDGGWQGGGGNTGCADLTKANCATCCNNCSNTGSQAQCQLDCDNLKADASSSSSSAYATSSSSSSAGNS